MTNNDSLQVPEKKKTRPWTLCDSPSGLRDVEGRP